MPIRTASFDDPSFLIPATSQRMLREMGDALGQSHHVRQLLRRDGGHLRVTHRISVPMQRERLLQLDLRVTDELGGGKTIEEQQAEQIQKLNEANTRLARERRHYREALVQIAESCHKCQGAGTYLVSVLGRVVDVETRRYPCESLACTSAREALKAVER